MLNFILEEKETGSPPVLLTLEAEDDVVFLKATRGSGSKVILCIHPDGRFSRCGFAEDVGMDTGSGGKIIEKDEEE